MNFDLQVSIVVHFLLIPHSHANPNKLVYSHKNIFNPFENAAIQSKKRKINFFCSLTGHLRGHKRYLEASRVMEEYAQVGRVMCLAAFMAKTYISPLLTLVPSIA